MTHTSAINTPPPSSLVLGSYLFAIILDAMLISSHWLYWLPSISLLTVLYWSNFNLNATFIPSAFLLGLMYDTLTQSTLGVHALLFSTLLFILLRFRLQFRSVSLFQQALALIPLFYLYQGGLWLFLQPSLTTSSEWLYWLTSPLTTLLIWPILAFLYQLLLQRAN